VELDKKEKPFGNQDRVLAQLYRTMRWCASRQVLVELTSGTYQTSFTVVNVQQFVRSSLEDKGCDYLSSVLDETVGLGSLQFDETMAWVVLENALSNAFVHGDGRVKLSVKFDVETSTICFILKNHVPTKCESNISASRPPLRSKKAPPSTHCGLQHASLACNGAGGTYTLEFIEDLGVRTAVFSVSLPAAMSKCSPAGRSPSHEDDGPQLPEKLTVYAIDDSRVICKGIDRILLKALKADRSTSVVCCPENESDVAFFIEQVLVPNPPVALVLLDQNIELEHGSQLVLGTSLADELRAQSYKGLLVIRSANAATSDDDEYLRSGSVDICIGKHESLQNSVGLIARAYAAKKRND